MELRRYFLLRADHLALATVNRSNQAATKRAGLVYLFDNGPAPRADI
jgi:hypothetical protein